jgi:hypothetical protein
MRTANIVALMCGLMASSPDAGPRAAEETLHVSLLQLIANPTQFDGKRVRVIGFCWLEYESRALYLSETDFRYGITKNGVRVDLQGPKELSGGYVLLEGVFRVKRPGSFVDPFSGFIERIDFATAVKRRNR